MIGALVAAQAAVQRSSSSMGKRAAANEQQYGQTSSSKQTTVWAEELHRRQGRSRRTGARAGEKEQQGLAQEIEEHAREIKEEACELLVHLIVEAGSGNACEELRPGGNAAAHARGSRRMRVSSKRMHGSSKRTHVSSRRTCREVPTTPAGNRGGAAGTWRRRLRRRWSRYVATAAEHFLLCGESRSWAAPAPGYDGGRRRGRRELFQIVLKLEGLFCKITNELRPGHVFGDGGSSSSVFSTQRYW